MIRKLHAVSATVWSPFVCQSEWVIETGRKIAREGRKLGDESGWVIKSACEEREREYVRNQEREIVCECGEESVWKQDRKCEWIGEGEVQDPYRRLDKMCISFQMFPCCQVFLSSTVQHITQMLPIYLSYHVCGQNDTLKCRRCTGIEVLSAYVHQIRWLIAVELMVIVYPSIASIKCISKERASDYKLESMRYWK